MNWKDRSGLHTSLRGISDVHLTLDLVKFDGDTRARGIDLLFKWEFFHRDVRASSGIVLVLIERDTRIPVETVQWGSG